MKARSFCQQLCEWSRRDEVRGLGALLLAILLFSSVETASKMLSANMPPLWLAVVRFCATGLILLLPALRNLRMRRKPFGMRELRIVGLLSLVGVAFSIGLYHLAIPRMQANVAAIVFSTHPAFVVLFAPFLLHERPGWRQHLAVWVGLGGIAVFLVQRAGHGGASLSGLALMFGALFFFALYSVLSKKYMPEFGAIVITALASLGGGLILLPLAWGLEGPPGMALQHAAWGGVAYLTLAATVVAYVAYFWGLLNVGAARGAMIFFLKPFLATLYAYLWLREPVTGPILAGGALVLCSMALAMWPSRSR